VINSVMIEHYWRHWC